MAQWVKFLTCNLPDSGYNPTKGSRCFLEQETLP